jgi:hypothetical protein
MTAATNATARRANWGDDGTADVDDVLDQQLVVSTSEDEHPRDVAQAAEVKLSRPPGVRRRDPSSTPPCTRNAARPHADSRIARWR